MLCLSSNHGDYSLWTGASARSLPLSAENLWLLESLVNVNEEPHSGAWDLVFQATASITRHTVQSDREKASSPSINVDQ